MSGCHPRETFYCGDNRVSQCTCKCHVSQNNHCDNCYQYTSKDGKKYDLVNGVLSITYPKKETITIKKALWDEMLSYKNTTDKLVARINKLENLYKPFTEIENHSTIIAEMAYINKKVRVLIEMVEKVEKTKQLQEQIN